MQHLTEPLQRAGLSEREARVYLSALSLGCGSAQEIAHAAQVTRTTAYHIIDNLVESGLMSTHEHKNKKVFTPSSPQRVVDMMHERAQEMLQHVEAVQEVLPELMAFENVDEARPKVYMYEGKEGLRQLSKRVEEVEGEFIEIVPLDAVREFYQREEMEDHKTKMTKNQIRGRVLITADEAPIEFMRHVHGLYGWEFRYIGAQTFPLRGHITVKGSEVYGFSYQGIPTGVLVDNPHMADAVRVLFDWAWKGAKDVPAQYPQV